MAPILPRWTLNSLLLFTLSLLVHGVRQMECARIHYQSIQKEAVVMNTTLQEAGLQEVASGKVSGHCGIQKTEIDDGATADNSISWKGSIQDPRSVRKQLGWVRFLGAFLLQSGRHITNTRYAPVALEGHLAKGLIEASFGIMTAEVPRRCFQPLHEVLLELNVEASDLGSRTDKNLSRMDGLRKKLLSLLESMQHGCSNEVNLQDVQSQELREEREKGYIAYEKLKALQWGYWSLYQPLVKAESFVIAARFLDRRRMLKGNLKLRQIWRYAKMHIFLFTEIEIRTMMRAHSKHESNTEYARLKKTLKALIRLEWMRNARLEFMEYDGLGHCVSAQNADNPLKLLEKLNTQSGQFRVVLMFRERAWQFAAHAWKNFFLHPISSTRKFGESWQHEWSRGSGGHKFAMILGPIVRMTAYAGLVLGLATMGQVSFATLIVESIVDSAFARYFASTSIITFLLSKVLAAPLQDALTEESLTTAESLEVVQKVISKLDENKIFLDGVKRKVDETVEAISADPEIGAQLDQLSNNSRFTKRIQVRFDMEELINGDDAGLVKEELSHPFGFDYDDSYIAKSEDYQGLKLNSIGTGRTETLFNWWNRENEDETVHEGDVIVEVNGKSDITSMKEEIESAKKTGGPITFNITRDVELVVDAVEDEVKEHVRGLVLEGFAGVVAESVHNMLTSYLSSAATSDAQYGSDPQFGWTSMRIWKKYNENKLLPVGTKVALYAGRMYQLGSCTVIRSNVDHVALQPDSEQWHLMAKTTWDYSHPYVKVLLVSENFDKILVHDPRTFQIANTPYMPWPQWTMYRKRNNAMGLKGLDIYYDFPKDKPLTVRPWERANDNTGGQCFTAMKMAQRGRITVSSAYYKVFGRSRWIEVSMPLGGGIKCGFFLTADVKKHIWVKDSHAWNRFLHLGPSKAKEEAWMAGKLNSEDSVDAEAMIADAKNATLKEVSGLSIEDIKMLACQRKSDVSQELKSVNEALLKRYNVESSDLEDLSEEARVSKTHFDENIDEVSRKDQELKQAVTNVLTSSCGGLVAKVTPNRMSVRTSKRRSPITPL